MRIVFASVVLFLFSACNGGDDRPDVSGIDMKVSVERFDKSLFGTDTARMVPGLQQVYAEHRAFYPFYMNEILLLKGAHTAHPDGRVELNAEGEQVLRNFFRAYRPIFDSVNNRYSNLGWLEQELKQGFRYVKHYFPEYRIPEVVTYLATFDAPGIVMTPRHLGIGLHQYAGKNFSVYRNPQILEIYPEYISRRFDREYMAANCMKAIADDIYPDRSVGKPLVEQMIEKGKQWFLADKFLPDAADTVITGYTQKQVDWVDKNEGNIWAFFQKNVDLFSINVETVQDFLGEAPATKVMSDAAPGNIGQWVGWRIVRAYAEKNPEMSLKDIVATPARQILDDSKYRPK